MFLAGVHAALGDKDEAFHLLDQSYAERSVFLPVAKNCQPAIPSSARFAQTAVITGGPTKDLNLGPTDCEF